MLGDIAAAGATAARNIANFVLDGCGLTHAEADLQGFGNFGNGAGPLYASISGQISTGRFANAVVATSQSRLLNENADQVKEGDRQSDIRTTKRYKVAKWTVSEAAAARAPEKKAKRSCKSDDVLDGCRRNVDERTRRNLDESTDES